MAARKKDETTEGQQQAEQKQSEGKSTQVAERPKLGLITLSGRGLQLTTLDDMYRLAQYVVTSGMAPKNDTAVSLVIKIETGLELGIPPMMAIRSIAVINNRATLWGDAVPGLVLASGQQESYEEKEIGTPGTGNYGWLCRVKRKGQNWIEGKFTIAEAKLANLLPNKPDSSWTKYPNRMLKMRARTYALRDAFPDVLQGIYTAEEIQDAVFEDITDRSPQNGTKTARLADSLKQQIQPTAAETEPGFGTPPATMPEEEDQVKPATEPPTAGTEQTPPAAEGQSEPAAVDSEELTAFKRNIVALETSAAVRDFQESYNQYITDLPAKDREIVYAVLKDRSGYLVKQGK